MARYSGLLQETLAGLHAKSPNERSLSPTSTVLYEEEEQQWPGCFSPDPKQQEAMAIGIGQEEEQWPSRFAPKILQEDVQRESQMCPILPMPGRRKRAVLRPGSMNMKQKRSMEVALKGTGCSKCRYARNGSARCRK